MRFEERPSKFERNFKRNSWNSNKKMEFEMFCLNTARIGISKKIRDSGIYRSNDSEIFSEFWTTSAFSSPVRFSQISEFWAAADSRHSSVDGVDPDDVDTG